MLSPPIPPATPAPRGLTLAVCTWNRAERLRRLLDSVAAARPPSAPWEVIVVDNNSKDATRAVAASFTDRLPLRYTFEPEQGLSAARNRAVTEARFALLLFTDDDITVDPGFLEAHLAAADAHPDAAFFGGSIKARFEGREPSWIHLDPAIFTTAFGEIEAPAGGAPIIAPHLPYGANFAIRQSALAGARFDPTLGLIGSRRIHGEETDLLNRLAASGAQGRWVPEAVAYHWISAAHTDARYLLRYFVGLGRTRVLLGDERSPLLDAAAAARTVGGQLARAAVRVTLRHPAWVAHVRLAAIALGELQETLRAITDKESSPR